MGLLGLFYGELYLSLTVHVYARKSAEIQTTPHWNLIGRSITASSILPPSSFRGAFILAWKNEARVSRMPFIFFYFVELRKSENA